MHIHSSLIAVVAALSLATLGGCPKNVPGGGGVPRTGNLPDSHGVPGGLSGASGEIDPNTCGNYAAVDAGRKLKAFLQATKDLDTTLIETAKVVKQSCVMMGQELGMPPADLQGETDPVCNRVIATYKNNLKVTLKAGAKLTIKFKPAVCTVDAQASARAAAACEGGASAGTGGGGAGGQCKAAAGVDASLHAQCNPPELTITAEAGVVLDASKLEMTLKALRNGLPNLISIHARLEPLKGALQAWGQSAGELAAMGPKFTQSFADQAACIAGQISAVMNAKTRIEANFSVSVSVSASASATAGGG
jgi:hypothetical protein